MYQILFSLGRQTVITGKITQIYEIQGVFSFFSPIKIPYSWIMSQDTDLASSSFHGSYGLDLFPSDLESSQQTIESTPASELLPPMISSSLERFGNDWIVYSEMSKEDFIFWWLQTIHGNELRERNKSFWDRSRSHSEAWNSFKQVAHTVTGDPKIVCQKCGQLLDHPSRKLNGTTPMARHLRGEKCQRLSNRVVGNSSLQELFARQVRNTLEGKR